LRRHGASAVLPRAVRFTVLRPSPLAALFVARLGSLRHRHSFPTRRSSDLPKTHKIPNSFALPPGWSNTAAQIWDLTPPTLACRIDRKSTRLNSSHVSISYAVFCLKKKPSTGAHLIIHVYRAEDLRVHSDAD